MPQRAAASYTWLQHLGQQRWGHGKCSVRTTKVDLSNIDEVLRGLEAVCHRARQETRGWRGRGREEMGEERQERKGRGA